MQTNMALSRGQTKEQKPVFHRVRCNFNSLYFAGTIKQGYYCISMMILNNLASITLDLKSEFKITHDVWDTYRSDSKNRNNIKYFLSKQIWTTSVSILQYLIGISLPHNPYLSKKFSLMISQLTCRTVHILLPGFSVIQSSESAFIESNKANRPQVQPNTILFFNNFFEALSNKVKKINIKVQTQEKLSKNRVQSMLEKTTFQEFVKQSHPQEVQIFGFKWS